MTITTPLSAPLLAKEWFSPKDLIGLAGMPESEAAFSRWVKRHELRRADRLWHATRNPTGIWRKAEKQQGGGYEYHYSVLPPMVQTALMVGKAMLPEAAMTPAQAREATRKEMGRDALWEWFDGLTDAKKDKARERLSILLDVDTLYRGGMTKDHAVRHVAAVRKIAESTIYALQQRCHGRDRSDWLPCLADRRMGRTATADCDPEAWELIKTFYLRKERPDWQYCYDDLAKVAAEKGWTIPSARTLHRRLEKEVPRAAIVWAREGRDAVKRLYPPQERDRGVFHALEAVNMDGHIWDVWVKWPDGTVARPAMVALQDLYSGLILSWRIDLSENAEATRLAIGDMVELYGIPDHLVTDNGRAFASKMITGGTATRYRFKVKADEPTGVLTTLGVQVHWTTPFSGQSKPIERAFRDFCARIAKDIRLAGAWAGNRVDNKPDYKPQPVDLDLFLKVVAERVTEHNARPGRRSATAAGRSLLETFLESYREAKDQALIRTARPEQSRLWLLGAEGVKADKDNGAVKLMGNRFWSEFMVQQAGKPLTIRFDPQDLHGGVHVYALDGRYLGFAECWEPAGFLDVEAARKHTRNRRAWVKAQKAVLEAERSLSLSEAAALLPAPEKMPEIPDGGVVARPVFGGLSTRGATALKPVEEASVEALGEALGEVFDFDTAFAAGLRLVTADE